MKFPGCRIHGPSLLLATVVLTTGVLPAQPDSPSRVFFPGMEREDAQGMQGEVVTRLVDGLTGRPIPGGRMTAHREADHPLCGESAPLATAIGDADGWVRQDFARLGARPNFWVFQAEGYGPVGAHGDIPDFPIRMMPARNVDFVLRDAFGEPVPDAGVGLLLGCGHTPDIRFERSDARGRVTMKGIDPGSGELWVHAPGVYGEYFEVERRPSGATTLWCRPSRPVTGRVLDAAGKPVVGAFVGCPNCHRGPWAPTDAAGRFSLWGALEGFYTNSVYVHVPAIGSDPLMVRDVPPPGFEMTLRIPSSGEYEDDDGPCEIDVTVVDEAGKAIEGTRVLAVRPADGYGSSGSMRDGLPAEFSLKPGRFRFQAGRELGPWVVTWHDAEVDLVSGKNPPLEIRLKRKPLLILDVAGFPADGEVWLATRTSSRNLTDEWREAKGALPVPPRGRVAVQLKAGGRVKVHEITAADRRQGRVSLGWFAPTRVRAQLVDESGAAVEGWIEVSHEDEPPHREELVERSDLPSPSATPTCTSTRVGECWLHVLPRDDRHPLFVRRLLLPPGEGQEIDLGRILVPDPNRVVLTAALPGGRPAAGAGLYLRRFGGAHQAWLSLDAGGALRASTQVLRAGDHVRLTAKASGAPAKKGVFLLPLNTILEGEDPFELTWPSGGLELTVTHAGGAPYPNFEVIIGGLTVDGHAGSLTLEGLADGPQDVVVLGRSGQATVCRFTVENGELVRKQVVIR